MTKTVDFICVWRLAQEKWSHLLLWAIEKIAKMRGKFSETVHIHIFWKWVLTEKFIEVSERYSFVTYHGHQPKVTVLDIRKKCHYTLMPSLFLETFGLSALDWLSVWTPIIWFSKWGLAQFIDEKYALKEHKTKEKLIEWIRKKITFLAKNHNPRKHVYVKKKMIKKYEWYVRENRYKHFKKLLPKHLKRIMFISDYSADIWWIENRIHIVVNNLKKVGYTVSFVWWIEKPIGKVWLFLNLFRTACNFTAGRRIKQQVDEFKPDVIWRHSVHRVLWRYPLSLIKKKSYQQRIMYHDFGLFHPYPSRVYHEKQLHNSRKIWWFMNEWMKKWFWNTPLLIAKWISYSCIKKQLMKNINLHLVPSAYMLWNVNAKWYIWKNAAIDVLPHFINKPE